MKAYLAAPLFNPWEREFNHKLALAMRPRIEVFLPQVDGLLLADLLACGMPIEQARRRVFEGDIDAILAADILMVVLNGRSIDEGACFELGLAWAHGKACFGYRDDCRQLLASGDNPMIAASLTRVFASLEEVAEWANQDIDLPAQRGLLSQLARRPRTLAETASGA